MQKTIQAKNNLLSYYSLSNRSWCINGQFDCLFPISPLSQTASRRTWSRLRFTAIQQVHCQFTCIFQFLWKTVNFNSHPVSFRHPFLPWLSCLFIALLLCEHCLLSFYTYRFRYPWDVQFSFSFRCFFASGIIIRNFLENECCARKTT